MENRNIWCLAEGDPYASLVPVPADATIYDLKELIKEEKSVLKEIDAARLKLLKLKDPLPIESYHTVEDRLAALLSSSSNSYEELHDVTDKVSTFFPNEVSQDHIHIYVEVVSVARVPAVTGQKHTSSDTSSEGGKRKRRHPDYAFALLHDLAPRPDTVARLYAQLNRDRYVQVRGTPASGKSSLAELLFHHIKNAEPNTEIVLITGWHKETDEDSALRLSSKWDFQEGAVLMIDEAQVSYWDKTFWNLIKAISPETSSRVITFAFYGSAFSVHGDPGISPSFTISLRPVVAGSAALLLTKTEFDDLVLFKFPNHRFDMSLLDSIFDLTNGHVGACMDLLRFTQSHESYIVLHGHDDAKYTDTDFIANIPMSYLVNAVQIQNGVSWRGLPKVYHLQKKDIADVFQQVIRDGRISIPESDIPSEPLLKCVRAGWLHTSDTAGMSDFALASTWHKRYVECLLSGHIDESSIINFAKNEAIHSRSSISG